MQHEHKVDSGSSVECIKLLRTLCDRFANALWTLCELLVELLVERCELFKKWDASCCCSSIAGWRTLLAFLIVSFAWFSWIFRSRNRWILDESNTSWLGWPGFRLLSSSYCIAYELLQEPTQSMPPHFVTLAGAALSTGVAAHVCKELGRVVLYKKTRIVEVQIFCF